jgi:hypothetical protein
MFAMRKGVTSGHKNHYQKSFKMDTYKVIVDKKHHWLLSHVDVKYPTPESILGRDLYQQRENRTQYQEYSLCETTTHDRIEEIYLVDFHRLTVMFAKLQSDDWKDEKSRQYVLEFFAQTTLSEDHHYYLGFIAGKPIIAAIVTCMDKDLLVSDIVTKDSHSNQIKSEFIERVATSYPQSQKIFYSVA